MPEVSDVANPRRVLAVSLEDAAQHLTRVVKDLTGSLPEPASTSLAGTTHDLRLKTAYYTATVPVWLDLIASPADWAASFLSEEAGEVLAVLGGIVIVFPLPGTQSAASTRDLIKHVGRVVKEGLGGWEWDGVGLAVGIGEGEVDEWDGLCAEAGLEFVQLTGKDQGRNEFGEKMGIPRVKEALEANDWAQVDASGLSDFGDFESGVDDVDKGDGKDLDPESLDFGFDRADFEGLRKAIWSSGQDEQAADEATAKPADGKELNDEDVAQVERMMGKLQAARDAGEGLPPEQRRRLAARAVEEVMKDL